MRSCEADGDPSRPDTTTLPACSSPVKRGGSRNGSAALRGGEAVAEACPSRLGG